MTSVEIYKVFDKSVIQMLSSILKPLGFRRASTGFRRDIGPVTQFISWAKISPIYTHGLPERYLEIQIFSFRLYEALFGPKSFYYIQNQVDLRNIRLFECHLRDLPPNYSVSSIEEIPPIVEDLRRLMVEYCVKLLEQCQTEEDIIDVMRSTPKFTLTQFKLDAFAAIVEQGLLKLQDNHSQQIS